MPERTRREFKNIILKKGYFSGHTGDFPRGVGHRVENGRGLTKVAVVLLNGLIW